MMQCNFSEGMLILFQVVLFLLLRKSYEQDNCLCMSAFKNYVSIVE